MGSCHRRYSRGARQIHALEQRATADSQASARGTSLPIPAYRSGLSRWDSIPLRSAATYAPNVVHVIAHPGIYDERAQHCTRWPHGSWRRKTPKGDTPCPGQLSPLLLPRSGSGGARSHSRARGPPRELMSGTPSRTTLRERIGACGASHSIATFELSSPSGVDLGDVDFFHGHHGVEGAFGFGAADR